MVENELVKVNPKAFELDCVLEVEEADDSVATDVSVVCCALAPSVISSCRHIHWVRMVVKVPGFQQIRNIFSRRECDEQQEVQAAVRDRIYNKPLDIRSLCTYAQVSSHATAIPSIDLARFSHSQSVIETTTPANEHHA